MKRRAGLGIVAVCVLVLTSQSVLSVSSDGLEQAAVTQSASRLDPPRTLVVTAGGDILADRGVRDAGARAGQATGARYDFVPMFAGLSAVTATADLSICHMELPLGWPGAYAGPLGGSPFGGNRLIAPIEMAAGIRAAGFDRCSTASNHSWDAGADGVASTLHALDAAGLSHTGNARTPAEAVPTVFAVDGVAVGHLSYTRYSNMYWPAESWRQARASSTAAIAADVQSLRSAGADVVIVSIHLLKEMLSAPTSYDREFTTRMIAEADIDLVVHHGAHVIQPVEFVYGTPVYWSVGNMVTGMGVPGQGKYVDKRTLDGLMATVEFVETSNGTWAAHPRTFVVCTDTQSRVVRVAKVALNDPNAGLSTREIIELQQCIARTEALLGPVH